MTKKELLKSKKLHVTDFRLTVLSIIQSFENAISIDQIEEELGEFDRITLYRTIKAFKEKGLIHEIQMNDSVKKIALCTEECEQEAHHHEHIHFHCENCQEVYCLDIQQLPEIKIPGFSISQLEVQATGMCDKCA